MREKKKDMREIIDMSRTESRKSPILIETKDIDRNKPFHFIAIDAYGWATGKTIAEAEEKRFKGSGGILNMNIWYVPLGEYSEYDIYIFIPQVNGIVIVKQIKMDRDTQEIVVTTDIPDWMEERERGEEGGGEEEEGGRRKG